MHVLADAATSVLAILALIGGWLWGWSWLDPVMGIVGAVMVAIWAKGLVLQTGQVLVDREMDHPVVDEIREAVATIAPLSELRLTDLHVWRVGRQAYACALTVVTTLPDLTPRRVRQALRVHEEIRHATIEVQHVRQPVADLAGLPDDVRARTGGEGLGHARDVPGQGGACRHGHGHDHHGHDHPHSH